MTAASEKPRLSRSSKAIAMRRSRAKGKDLEKIAVALIDTNRLGAWDEKNRVAIKLALWKVSQEWAACVTSNGVDPLLSRMFDSEIEPE